MNTALRNTSIRLISSQALRSSSIEKNVPLQQFRLKLDGNDYATVEYEENDQQIDLIHAVVPPHYKGQGIGNVLAEVCLCVIAIEVA